MKPTPPAEVKLVRALRRRGLPITVIAAETGVSRSAIGRLTADMRADARARANRTRARAESAALPWLTEARRLLGEGVTRNRISARLAVPKTVVYRHLKRQKPRHPLG